MRYFIGPITFFIPPLHVQVTDTYFSLFAFLSCPLSGYVTNSKLISVAAPNEDTEAAVQISYWFRILVQVTIYRRLLIGRDDHLDQL